MNNTEDVELRENIRLLLQDAMGDFPTEHLLKYHTDNLEALIHNEKLKLLAEVRERVVGEGDFVDAEILKKLEETTNDK